VNAPTVLLTAIEPLTTHVAITTDPHNTSPEDISHTSGGGIEASNEGDCAGRKRSLRELREFEKQQAKWARKDGAIVAASTSISHASGSEMKKWSDDLAAESA
jgi:hypothetical protein